MAKHISTGKDGEETALKFLLSKGYSILERNWRFSHAEIDIVAQKENTIVFIEVKARTNTVFGFPEESVSVQKQALLFEAANEYMENKQMNMEVRFDIIALNKNDTGQWTIKHFEDAFYPNPTDELDNN